MFDEMFDESDILYETLNLCLCRTGNNLQILLVGLTHSIEIGRPRDIESGKRAMERLERYPVYLRAMYNHP